MSEIGKIRHLKVALSARKYSEVLNCAQKNGMHLAEYILSCVEKDMAASRGRNFAVERKLASDPELARLYKLAQEGKLTYKLNIPEK